ncbi:MAG: hypothetical protein WCO03_03060 [bacterium]
MIILLHGNDRVKSLKKYRAYMDTLVAKHPEASVFEFDTEHFDQAQFAEMIVGQTLFYNKFIIGCDNLSQDKEAEQMIRERTKDMAASENMFVLLENKISKNLLTKIKKHAWKEEEFLSPSELAESAAKKKAESEQLFAVSNGIIARNREKVWVSYQEALRAGHDPIEVFWIISWAVKNLLLVITAEDPTKLGLNPYVVGKTLQGATKYTIPEARNLSARLMELFHTTFSETDEFAVGLEKILLSL